MGDLLYVCVSGGLLGFAMIVLAAALSIVTPVATHVTCLGMEASQVLISCCLTVYCSIAFLFRESGNSKSIWNNIFFPVALPSNFGTWSVYPVISKNLPWLFYLSASGI